MVKKDKKNKKQDGGYINWDKGGTSGRVGVFVDDIIGLVVHTINTMTDSIDVMQSMINLPNDMGTAFTEKAAPTPDQVNAVKIVG